MRVILATEFAGFLVLFQMKSDRPKKQAQIRSSEALLP